MYKRQSIDISSVMGDLEPRLMEMELGPLFGLWFQSLFIGITMWALYICIFIVIYGRMLEIYLVTSVAPVSYTHLSFPVLPQKGNRRATIA